jgi:di- and tripeptidase
MPDLFANNSPTPECLHRLLDVPPAEIPRSNVLETSHYGYVYCLAILEGGTSDGPLLCSGSGDETVKVSVRLTLAYMP